MTVHSAITMLPPEEAAKQLRSRGPVSTRPYLDPEWYELERQAIFLRSWTHIGHVCELPEPGSFIKREVEFARASLLIVRGLDGEIRAFHNACVHRGTELVQEAQGQQRRFSCPYHMWTYGTDGQLISAPDFERFHVDKADCSLKPVALEVCAGLIFVNFAKAPKESVREFLGAIADELEALPVARATSFSEYSYDIEANWKLNYDNFQENYHLKFIHPRTAGAAAGTENPFGYPVAYGFLGPHRSQQLWKNPSPPPIPPMQMMAMRRALAMGEKDGLNIPKVDYKLFPCLHIVGQAFFFFSHTMFPLGPTRTRASIRLYWVSDADSASSLFAREFAAMSIRDVHAEDRNVIEAGQRGITGGAIEQFHFQDHEMLLRHQYETVQEKVEQYLAEQQSGKA